MEFFNLRASAVVFGIFAALGVLATAPDAWAATITVTTTDMLIDAGPVDPHTGLTATAADLDIADLPGPDGFVSLPEAIIAANNTAGSDEIQLANGTTYTITTPTNFWYGPTALPPIVSDITIEGNGSTIARDGAAGKMRLFFVAGNRSNLTLGTLTLRNLTLANGLARGGNGGPGGTTAGGGGMGAGGAIFNQGSVILDAVTATGNTARGGAGGDSQNGGNRGPGGGMGGDGFAGNPGGGGGGFRTDGGFGTGGHFTTTEGAIGVTGGTSLFGGDGGNGASFNGGGGGGGFEPADDGQTSPNDQGGIAGNGGGNGGTGFTLFSSGGAGAFGGGGCGGQSGDGAGGGGGVGGGGGAAGGAGGGAGGFGGGGGASNSPATGFGGFGGGGGGSNSAADDTTGGFGGGDGMRMAGNNSPGGGGGGLGGVIFNHAGTLTLTNCTFANNTAQGGAGGDSLNGSGHGGYGGDGFGAGIFNLNGTVTALNCTFATNTVTPGTGGTPSGGVPGTPGIADGGAIYNLGDGATATFSLTNCILADTTGGTDAVGNTINAGTNTISGATNLIESQNGIPGGIIASTADPALGVLQDNGGQTFTMLPAFASPAVDAGTNAGAPATDQRGIGRLDNGTVDIGAVELNMVNDAPVITVPAAQNAVEDAGPLVFSSGNGNAISIADGDAGTNAIEVSLTATDGTVTLATVAGLTFSVGDGTADATMTFTAALSAANTALDGVSFAFAADFNGAASLQIVVDDLGNTGPGGAQTDSDSVAITVAAVNDAPSFSAANPPTIDEDLGAQTVANWVTASSPGPANEAAQSLGFVVSNISVAGFFTVAPAIDAAGTLTYTPAPNAAGSVTFDVAAMDDGGTANGGTDTSAAQTFTLTVAAVNDAPAFTATVASFDLPPNPGEQKFVGWAVVTSTGGMGEAGQLASFLVGNVSDAAFFTVAPTVAADGTLTFTPTKTANGSVTFDVQVKDDGGTANGGSDTSAAQTITITVRENTSNPLGSGCGAIPTATGKPDSAAPFWLLMALLIWARRRRGFPGDWRRVRGECN